MPIWEDDGIPSPSQTPSIMQRVRAGNALPILSHNAMFDLALFGFEAFKRYYAKCISYPHAELPDIGQLAHFDRYADKDSDINCKEFYLTCLKNHIYREAERARVGSDILEEAKSQVDHVGVSRFASLLGYPRFDQAQTLPLQVLANLPFEIYLTLSATNFLEVALRRAGKTPFTQMCRWSGPIEAQDKELWQIPDDYNPSEGQPLVYHLCGLDTHPDSGKPLPESLALSEDDHLEMLVNLAEGRGRDGADRLPALVRGALFKDVVLLGFRLDSWAFRGLYYGLIRETGQERDRRGVCIVQLPAAERKKQEKYLQGYLDRKARFKIYSGDLNDFAGELKESQGTGSP